MKFPALMLAAILAFSVAASANEPVPPAQEEILVKAEPVSAIIVQQCDVIVALVTVDGSGLLSPFDLRGKKLSDVNRILNGLPGVDVKHLTIVQLKCATGF